MDAQQFATFRRHTGRTHAPAQPAREAWVIVGRRGAVQRAEADGAMVEDLDVGRERRSPALEVEWCHVHGDRARGRRAET